MPWCTQHSGIVPARGRRSSAHPPDGGPGVCARQDRRRDLPRRPGNTLHPRLIAASGAWIGPPQALATNLLVKGERCLGHAHLWGGRSRRVLNRRLACLSSPNFAKIFESTSLCRRCWLRSMFYLQSSKVKHASKHKPRQPRRQPCLSFTGDHDGARPLRQRANRRPS